MIFIKQSISITPTVFKLPKKTSLKFTVHFLYFISNVYKQQFAGLVQFLKHSSKRLFLGFDFFSNFAEFFQTLKACQPQIGTLLYSKALPFKSKVLSFL